MRALYKLTSVAAVATLALVAVPGCGSDGPPHGPTTGGTTGGATGGVGPTQKDTFSGVYDVTTTIDFDKQVKTDPNCDPTADPNCEQSILPNPAGPVLTALSMIVNQPVTQSVAVVTALLDLIKQVSDSGTAQLILGGIQAVAGSFGDSEVKTLIQQNTIANAILTTLQDLAQLTTAVTIHDTITIHTPDANNVFMVEHQLTSVDLTVNDLNGNPQPINIPISTTAQASAHFVQMGTLKPHNTTAADADVTLGKGTVSVPLGDVVLSALQTIVYQLVNPYLPSSVPQLAVGDLKSFLQAFVMPLDSIIDSSSLDSALKGPAKFAVNTGFPLIGGVLDSLIGKLALNGIQINNIKATLFDVSPTAPKVDQKADAISLGTWDWTFTGNDKKTLTLPGLTFSGKRIGNAN